MNTNTIKKFAIIAAAAIFCTTSVWARPHGPAPRGRSCPAPRGRCCPAPRPCAPRRCPPPCFGPAPCCDRGADVVGIVGASILGANVLANTIIQATRPAPTVVVQQPAVVQQPVVVQQQQPAVTSVVYQ